MDEIDLDVRLAERNQITENAVNNSDIVIVMAEKLFQSISLQVTKVRYWDIGIQQNQTLEEVRMTRDTINNLVKELVAEIE